MAIKKASGQLTTGKVAVFVTLTLITAVVIVYFAFVWPQVRFLVLHGHIRCITSSSKSTSPTVLFQAFQKFSSELVPASILPIHRDAILCYRCWPESEEKGLLCTLPWVYYCLLLLFTPTPARS